MDMSAYLTAPLQLEKICRACLTEKGDMKPLYATCLDKMLNSFTTIQAQSDDGLPSLLCSQCFLQCISAYTFKQQCEKSDSILCEFVKPEFQAQLQDSVMPILLKIEVNESSELDQYAEVANVVVKEEIEPEFVSCTDSDLIPHLNTIGQVDDAQKLDIVKTEASPSCKPLPSLRKDHKCKQCNREFLEAKQLKIHVRSHTGKRPYSCDICQRTFLQLCNLKDHVRVHTGEKPHLCPVCGKGYTQSGYMRQHMRTHTGVRPYVCATCGTAFARSYSLVIHERLHTVDQPYKCKTCKKCFSNNLTLLQHMSLHAGFKSHFCDVCGKGFKKSCNLTRHLRTHNSKKNYVCTACDNKYSCSSSLNRHMKSHLEEKVKEGNVAMDEEQFNESDESDPLKMSVA